VVKTLRKARIEAYTVGNKIRKERAEALGAAAAVVSGKKPADDAGGDDEEGGKKATKGKKK